MGKAFCFKNAQLDVRSFDDAKLGKIRTYGFVTPPNNIFSVDSQQLGGVGPIDNRPFTN